MSPAKSDGDFPAAFCKVKIAGGFCILVAIGGGNPPSKAAGAGPDGGRPARSRRHDAAGVGRPPAGSAPSLWRVTLVRRCGVTAEAVGRRSMLNASRSVTTGHCVGAGSGLESTQKGRHGRRPATLARQGQRVKPGRHGGRPTCCRREPGSAARHHRASGGGKREAQNGGSRGATFPCRR